MFRDLHRLYLLFTGRVPMYRIVRFLVVMLICAIILAAILVPIGRRMVRAVEPLAEDRVRGNIIALSLLGAPITFGSTRGIHFDEGSETGNGGFSLPVQGDKAKGDLDVEAEKVNGSWRLSSITLSVKDKSVPIPIQ
jgi:hypothetical protein